MITRIQGGWLEFDAVVATPDMMAAVGSKLGRILGPRGLLPNPRSGTVGPNIGELVRALKAGQIEFRNDKTGVVHAPIGKASFDAAKLRENLSAFRGAVEAAKPDTARGVFRPHGVSQFDDGAERSSRVVVLGKHLVLKRDAAPKASRCEAPFWRWRQQGPAGLKDPAEALAQELVVLRG
jgi:hypothetical protein